MSAIPSAGDLGPGHGFLPLQENASVGYNLCPNGILRTESLDSGLNVDDHRRAPVTLRAFEGDYPEWNHVSFPFSGSLVLDPPVSARAFSISERRP